MPVGRSLSSRQAYPIPIILHYIFIQGMTPVETLNFIVDRYLSIVG